MVARISAVVTSPSIPWITTTLDFSFPATFTLYDLIEMSAWDADNWQRFQRSYVRQQQFVVAPDLHSSHLSQLVGFLCSECFPASHIASQVDSAVIKEWIFLFRTFCRVPSLQETLIHIRLVVVIGRAIELSVDPSMETLGSP